MKRSYSGGANASSLLSGTTEITTVLNVAPLVNWPDYTQGPFIITVGRGGVNEEKMLCTEYTASTILVSQRGYDGTSPAAHSAGETVEHTIAAVDASEPNQHLNTGTGVHGLGGTDDVVGTEKTQTLTGKTMSGADNDFSNIPQSAVVGLPALQSARLPVGSITMWAGTGGIPGNWLLCNGGTVSRSTYAALFAAIGTTYGAGDGTTTFGLPNLVQRFPRGAATNGNATGGAATHTLAVGELPAHSHGLNSHTHTAAAHTHTTPALTHALGTHVGVAIPDHAARTHNHGGATGSALTGVVVQTTDPMSPQAGTGVSAIDSASAAAHTHTITTDNGAAQPHTVTVTQPTVNNHAAGVTGSTTPGASGAATGNTADTGSGTAFSTLPPYLDIRFIILAA